MPPTGEEIRAALTAFAARWSVYEGSERSEAQTFVNELFECYGTDRRSVAEFEAFQAGRFLDLIWPRVCIVEMKAPSEARRLQLHREQALDYWRNAADPATQTPAPRWVILCAFRSLEIWEPGAYPGAPRLQIDLIDLPDQYDALLFLAERDREPVFAGGQAKLTREAVEHLVGIYEALRERRAAGPDTLRDFLLQCVWCLFAEDLGQLPAHRFTHLLEQLIAQPQRSSADELGGLFEYLNSPGGGPGHGLYAGTPYANGRLFERPARVHLEHVELLHLRMAAQFQWRDVQPSIFGSLLEGGLGHDQQWRLGAHYTHEADIQKVVQPTIVEPWRERIENIETHAEATAAQNDLLQFVVLDPACGSGNFLYVAYRELRRLEKRLHVLERELRRREGRSRQDALDIFHFPLSNIKGIEIEPFAVALARVTLWMGHKLAVDELELPEPTLPLADLSGIRRADALRREWPAADAIIGNPPFHGDRHLRSLLGDDYVEWLKRQFGVGVKDYCVYWFRRAQDELPLGGRAGLVGTNSIRETRARSASLDYIASTGGIITNAVSTQDWPGEAAVDVSIVNWIKAPPAPPHRFTLDGEAVPGITTSLRSTDRPDHGTAHILPANAKRAFQGPIPRSPGFIIEEEKALDLLKHRTVAYRDVVRPYLTSSDIASSPSQSPGRWVIDFAELPLEEAGRYPDALEIIRERVRPGRLDDPAQLARWWQFWNPRPAMRAALSGLPRYIAGIRHGVRLHFVWCDPWWMASDATIVFAFSEDYAFGVLASAAHREWARALGSTLEARIRYTPRTSFGTFPWPEPDQDVREAIAGAARDIIRLRTRAAAELDGGLTKVYNLMDDGAFRWLAQAHRTLDEAVVSAYGWSPSIAQDADEMSGRLLELNLEIANGRPYSPFAALGP